MSNIEKIRQEIERLKEEYNEQVSARLISESLVSMGKVEALNKVLAFIDSLPEEIPPYVTGFKGHPDPAGTSDVEEAARLYADNQIPTDYPDYFCRQDIKDAFIAGAEWQARQLLKGSPLPEDTVLFQKGVEEGKRLMMEEAVEGEIVKDINNKLAVTAKNVILDGFKFGDKVKIIIVKK